MVSSKSLVERDLANFLLNKTNYNPAIRPVLKYTDTLTIKHGMALAQLIKVVSRSITF